MVYLVLLFYRAGTHPTLIIYFLMSMKIFILFIYLLFFNISFVMSQTIIPLYPDKIPNSKPSENQEKSAILNGILIISKVSIPTLSIYLPPKEKATGTAVIICPGGGYSILAAGHEGADVAGKLNEMGIAAFVLKYRIPNKETMVDPELGPLQDVQEAIKLVREGAGKWAIKSNRIGIMGFSAGGHLAATAGTHFGKSVITNTQNTSLRPDFMLLIYPVISFMDDKVHMGSRNQLIGEAPSPEKIISFSNELQVTEQTPPTFLIHASDDDAVKPENSISFYLALIKNHVPAELHIYQNSGHGFGMNLKNTNEHWMERCKNWIESNGWLKQ